MWAWRSRGCEGGGGGGGVRGLILLLHLVFALVHTATGAVRAKDTLKVTVTKVTADGALLTWVTSLLVTSSSQPPLTSCWLHYGPMTEVMQVQMEVRMADGGRRTEDRGRRAAERDILLANLSANTTYYAFLTCNHSSHTYDSNTVRFTPHGDPAVALEVRPPPPPPAPPSPRPSGGRHGEEEEEEGGDGGIVVMMSQRHMNAPRRDPHNAVPSTSVILGAVCGVVGFLIINVTVVMAVRQYSHRRARRRRYLDLQLEQHGGYLYNFDQFMADYNQQINAGNS